MCDSGAIAPSCHVAVGGHDTIAVTSRLFHCRSRPNSDHHGCYCVLEPKKFCHCFFPAANSRDPPSFQQWPCYSAVHSCARCPIHHSSCLLTAAQHFSNLLVWDFYVYEVFFFWLVFGLGCFFSLFLSLFVF